MTTTEVDPHDIAADLRRQIEGGELAPGARLPGEARLADRYSAQVSRVRSAIELLRSEGLVISRYRSGTYVREYQDLEIWWNDFEGQHHANRWDGASDQWQQAIRELGHTPSVDVDVRLVRPPRAVAETLQTTDVVVDRHLQWSGDGTPFVIEDAYIPMKIAEGTELMTPENLVAPGGMLRKLGYDRTYRLDGIKARMPSRDEIDQLRIPNDTPVIEHTRAGYSADDEPLHVTMTIFSGHMWHLRYRVGLA